MKKKAIVLKLLRSLPTNQHIVYVDSGYGGLNLAEDLNRLGFYFSMCCAKNRPSFLWHELQYNLPYGEFRHCSNEFGITALCFHSNKYVNIFTNFQIIDDVFEEKDTYDIKNKTKQKNKKRKTPIPIIERSVKTPAVVVDYRKNKNKVDVCDQMIAEVDPDHRIYKWPIALYLHILKCTLVNCWVIENCLTGSTCKVPIIDFLHGLALEMTQESIT